MRREKRKLGKTKSELPQMTYKLYCDQLVSELWPSNLINPQELSDHLQALIHPKESNQQILENEANLQNKAYQVMYKFNKLKFIEFLE